MTKETKIIGLSIICLIFVVTVVLYAHSTLRTPTLDVGQSARTDNGLWAPIDTVHISAKQGNLILRYTFTVSNSNTSVIAFIKFPNEIKNLIQDSDGEKEIIKETSSKGVKSLELQLVKNNPNLNNLITDDVLPRIRHWHIYEGETLKEDFYAIPLEISPSLSSSFLELQIDSTDFRRLNEVFPDGIRLDIIFPDKKFLKKYSPNERNDKDSYCEIEVWDYEKWNSKSFYHATIYVTE